MTIKTFVFLQKVYSRTLGGDTLNAIDSFRVFKHATRKAFLNYKNKNCEGRKNFFEGEKRKKMKMRSKSPTSKLLLIMYNKEFVEEISSHKHKRTSWVFVLEFPWRRWEKIERKFSENSLRFCYHLLRHLLQSRSERTDVRLELNLKALHVCN